MTSHPAGARPRGRDPVAPAAPAGRTVGQVAGESGITVRTLHHYDAIGLVCPSGRSAAGYRLYTPADVARLRAVVVYRRLGFSLEDIAVVMDDPDADIAAHLRRQRAAVLERLDDLRALVHALDTALEAEMNGTPLTPEEQRDLFGDGFSDELAREAEQRWGETQAWRQSQQRTRGYGRQDWIEIQAEMQSVGQGFVDAMQSGQPPASEAAMAAAEAARQHIDRRFYDCPPAMHRMLGDMYVQDPRFAATYEALAPGLAAYVRDAIHANADRLEAAAPGPAPGPGPGPTTL